MYYPEKENILEDALLRSKRAKLDPKVNTVEEGGIAQGILVITKSSIGNTEKVNIWKTTQDEDPIVHDTIGRLRQQQERNAFALTPQGLLV